MERNFRVDEDSMNQLMDVFGQLDAELNNAYSKFKTLISAMDNERSWKGESKKTFMAYMKLLEQYHEVFTAAGATQPVTEARKALSEYLANADTFYMDFAEYKILEAD